MDPQQIAVAREFDKHAVNYDGAVNDAIRFSGMTVDDFVRVKADHILSSLSGHFGRHDDLSVLDLGCGIGNYHDLLRGKFARLVGVDVSDASIEQARRARPEVEYLAYDGTRLPFDAHTFEAVYTICVMHHVPPAMWSGFVAEMHRVLKPGGLALIYEHNPKNPLTMKVVNDCVFDADAVLLQPRTARGLLREAGFGQVSSRSISTVPPVRIPGVEGVFASIDRLLGRFPFGTQYCAVGTKAID